MSNIGQGLAITVMGLGITFGALAIFIGVMVLLKRLFPAQARDAEEPKVPERETVSTLARDTSEEEIAVAITLALAHLYPHDNNLGKSLEAGSGPWWTAGQFEQHALMAAEIRGSK
jgi:sodium pump decarboxylase gamma subunit